MKIIKYIIKYALMVKWNNKTTTYDDNNGNKYMIRFGIFDFHALQSTSFTSGATHV